MLSECFFYQKGRKCLGTKKMNFKYKIIGNFKVEETSRDYLIQSPAQRSSN